MTYLFFPKYLVPAVAAASLSFAPGLPASAASATGVSVTTAAAPQGPQQKKPVDDSTFVGLDDLAQSSWPGLPNVSGIGSVPPPVATGLTMGGPTIPSTSVSSPASTRAPSLPQSNVMPIAPIAPLSQFLP